MPAPNDSPDSRWTDTRGAGLAAVVLAMTAFSWGFILVKSIPLSPAALATWRLLVGAGFLALVATVLRVSWPIQRGLVLLAGLAFGAHQLIFIAATKMTSIAIVTLMGATMPLVVTLASRRVVGEPLSRAFIIASLLAVAGVGIVIHASIDAASRSLTGDILAVINVLVFATYFLLAKKARTLGAPTLTFTAGFLAVSLVVVVPALYWQPFAVPDAGSFGLIAVLALIPGNGHLLVNWAHRRISAALSSLILASIPLLSSVWAYLLLDEPLTWRHAAGILVVIIAIELGRRAEAKSGTYS